MALRGSKILAAASVNVAANQLAELLGDIFGSGFGMRLKPLPHLVLTILNLGPNLHMLLAVREKVVGVVGLLAVEAFGVEHSGLGKADDLLINRGLEFLGGILRLAFAVARGAARRMNLIV